MRTWQRRMAAVVVAAVVVGVLADVMAQQKPAPATAKGTTADGLLGTAQYQEQVEGKLESAIASYKKVLAAPDASTSQKARAQLHIGLCYERLGLDEARKAYEAVLEKYAGEQESASAARARLAAMGQPKPAAAAGPVISQIWKTADLFDLSVSPDGTTVAGGDRQMGDLVLKSFATGTVRRLTANTDARSSVGRTLWSRDGRFVAYRWDTATNTSELWIADVRSGAVREVKVSGPDGFLTDVLDWAPDGKSLLIAVRWLTGSNPTYGVGWLSLDGRYTPLATTSWLPRSGAVSRDGQWGAYSSDWGNQPGVFVVSAAGGSPRLVCSGQLADTVIAWTPDDRALLLAGGKNEAQGRLVRLEMADGRSTAEPKVLREIPGLDPIGLSDAGALVYASRTPSRIDVYVAPFDLASWTVKGEAKRVSEPAMTSNSSPAWSPDSARLAWITRASALSERNMGIRVSVVEGGPTTAIAAPFLSNRPLRNLVWSSDGTSIIGQGVANRLVSVHRVAVSSGLSETLVPSDSPALTPKGAGTSTVSVFGVSTDGRLIYTAEQPPRRIVEYDLRARAERRSWSNPDWKSVRSVAISPDGAGLVVWAGVPSSAKTVFAGRLEVLAPEGGGSRAIPGTDDMRVNFYNWAPDGRTVLFTTFPEWAGIAEVWRVPVEGGGPKKVGLSMPYLQEAVISPDGKRIAFTGGTGGTDEGVWMMENFLPPSKPTKK